MRAKILLGLIPILAVAAWATDKIQPLNVKLGLWEITATTKATGQMPIPDDMLSKLTPEQRARLEARMKAQSNGEPKTRTYKSCLTKEKMEKDFSDSGADKSCTQTVLTSTGSKLALKLECASEGAKSSGTIEFEAVSPVSVKGSGQMTTAGGDHTMNISSTYAGKWIGPACGDVK